jgi:hypothetical protein
MTHPYPAGLYFVIATDENSTRLVQWKSETERQQANLRKIEWKSAEGCETWRINIEFKMAAQVPAFIKALERLKSKAKG